MHNEPNEGPNGLGKFHCFCDENGHPFFTMTVGRLGVRQHVVALSLPEAILPSLTCIYILYMFISGISRVTSSNSRLLLTKVYVAKTLPIRLCPHAAGALSTCPLLAR